MKGNTYISKREMRFLNGSIPIIFCLLLLLFQVSIFVLNRHLNFADKDSTWMYLARTVLMGGIAVLITWPAKESLSYAFTFIDIRKLLMVTSLISSIILLDICSGTMGAMNLMENNGWLYDICIIIVFPIILSILARNLREKSTVKDLLSSGVVIFSWNIIEFLLTYELSIAYLISMAIMHIVSVAVMVFTYEQEKKRLGNRIILCFLYIVFWVALIAIRNFQKENLITFLYGDSWDARIEYIRTLLANTSFWGSEFRSVNVIGHEFIEYNQNPIHTLLYYWGYASVIVYLVALILFMLLLYCFLGRRFFRLGLKPLYMVYHAAYMNLFLRVVLGGLYTFGLSPVRISLPFEGSSYLMDIMCIGILMISHLENRDIRKCLRMISDLVVKSPGEYGFFDSNDLDFYIERIDDEKDPEEYWWGDYCKISQLNSNEKHIFESLSSLEVDGKQIEVFSYTGVEDNEIIILENISASDEAGEGVKKYQAVQEPELTEKIVDIYKQNFLDCLTEEVNDVEDID